jgi:tetratricopeptide (TPR) repeat protein
MAHDLLGMAYEGQRRFPEALREFHRYRELSGHDPDAAMRLAIAYAESHETSRARELIAEMQRSPKGAYTPSYDIAAAYAALGEKELAFQWLGRALEQHASSCLLLAVDPALQVLRSDPRFQAAASKVGLSPVQ